MHWFVWLHKLRRFGFAVLNPTALILVWTLASPAWAADPIKVGFSMGMTGALLALESLRRVETIVAIELLCAAQGIELTDGDPGPRAAQILGAVRERVPALTEDRPPAHDIEAVRPLVGSDALSRLVRDAR